MADRQRGGEAAWGVTFAAVAAIRAERSCGQLGRVGKPWTGKLPTVPPLLPPELPTARPAPERMADSSAGRKVAQACRGSQAEASVSRSSAIAACSSA
jgi:hypothetical protein